jgi:hypothetical protein
MSLHNSAIIVRADFTNDLPRLFGILGLNNAQRKPELDVLFGESGDTFSDGIGGLGVIIKDGWTFLLGFEITMAIAENRIQSLGEQADLFAWQLEGTVAYASYQWWQNGRLIRHWEEMEYKILTDTGERIFENDHLRPGEIHTEERVFSAMEAVSISIMALWEQPLAAYVFPRNPIREWIRRWFRI